MAVRYRTQGFVFKKRDRGEADRVFSLFTYDFGRVEIFAKAIRKMPSKLRGGIDSFYLSDVEFIQGKNHKTLVDASAIKKNSAFLKDYEKLKVFLKIGSAIDRCIKGTEKDEALFLLLGEAFSILESMEQDVKKYYLLYSYFMWNFFANQGKSPEVAICARGKEPLDPARVYFSVKEGGTVCEKCAVSDSFAVRINSDVVKLMRLILKRDWPTLARVKAEKSSEVILYQLSENALAQFYS